MSTLDDVRAAVAELNDKFPRPGFSVSVSERYDLHTSFASSYPNVTQPGVYVLLDEAGTVLRIGKASCGRTLGHRLGDYFMWGDKALGKGVAKDEKFMCVRYISTIAVPKERAFESPAIEEFLLSKVKAPLNSVGVGVG